MSSLNSDRDGLIASSLNQAPTRRELISENSRLRRRVQEAERALREIRDEAIRDTRVSVLNIAAIARAVLGGDVQEQETGGEN